MEKDIKTKKIIGGNLTLVKNMPWIISIWTAIYLTSLGIYLGTASTPVKSAFTKRSSGLKESGKSGLFKYIFFSSVLVFLPHCNSAHYQFACYIFTAVVAFVSISEIQQVINYPIGLISFIITIMAYRIVLTNSFIDNVCICWAFTVGSCVFLGQGYNTDLVILQGMLFVWSFFAYAYMFTTIHGRVSFRSWENIRILLLLIEKTRYESASCLLLIEKQLPREVVEYIRSCSDAKEDSMDQFKSVDDDMVRAAISENIIPDVSASFHLTEKMLVVEGLQLRKTAVIIIRRQISDEQRDSALASLSEENFRGLLTMLARRKKITFLRQFGGAWIGCVGFFQSWGSEEQDCGSALQFAGEVSLLEKSLLGKLSIAVEFGNMTGGFLGSLDFDLFGQEIRWLLMMVELKLGGKVVIGDAVRKKVLYQGHAQDQGQSQGQEGGEVDDKGVGPLSPDLHQESFRLPWKIDSTIVVTYMVAHESRLGTSDFLDCVGDFTLRHGLQRNSIFYNDVRFDLDIRNAPVDSSEVTLLPSNGKTCSPIKSSAELCLELAYPQFRGMYRRLEAKGGDRLDQVVRQTWSQDIGIEFFTSIDERFGLDLSELSCSDQHIELTMASVRTFIDRFCFPTLSRYVFLTSAYQPRVGPNIIHQRGTVRAKKAFRGFAYSSPYESLSFINFSRNVMSLWRKKAPLCSGGKWRWRNLVALLDRHHNSLDIGTASGLESALSFRECVHEIESGTSPLYRKQTARHYCNEAKLLVQNRVLNALVNFLTHGISVLGVIGVVQTLSAKNIRETTVVQGITFTNKSGSIFIVLILSHLVLAVVLEGRYDYLMSVASVITQLVFIVLASILTNSPQNNGGFQIATWNTVGLHLVSFFSTLLDFRSVYIPMIVDSVIFGLLSWRLFLFGQQYQFALQKNLSSITFPFLHYMIWGLERNTYVCFILEHVLIPAANDNYTRQKKSTTAIKAALTPRRVVEEPFARSRSAVVIVAIHIKAADIISGFLDPTDLFVLLRKIICLVDECITRCDFVKMVQFSGFTMAFLCDDSNPAVSRSSPSVEAQQKVVALLKFIQDAMDTFNNENNFRIPLGIAINYGCANISPFANSFDLYGSTRDMALAMACFHHEGIFICDLFSSELFQSAGMRSSVYGQARVPKSLGYQWLQIDGDLSKLQLLNSFDYICRLGRGGFGSVHLLREKDSGVLYAIKMIMQKEGAAMSTLIKRECTILQMMSHPNVVSLKSSFLWNSRLYLVMSYVRGGNLRQVIVRDNVGLPHLQFWFAELVLAIEYVHSMGIIHRDIKPENCMIGTDGHLQLVDFGLAKIIYIKKSSEPGLPANERAPQLISKDARDKITQFFPLPLDLRNDAPVTVVLVTADSTSDICVRLEAVAVNVLVASSQSEVKAILREGKIRISAIFVDVDDKLNLFSKSHFWWFSDGMLTFHALSRPKQRFEHFYLNIAVYVIADCDEKARYKLKSAGVRECFSKRPVDYAAMFLALRRDLGLLFMAPAGTDAANSASSSQSLSFDAVSSTSAASTTSAVEGDSAEDDHVQDHVHSAVGTVHFLAPEVIQHQKYGKPVDWWACGVTFYECLAKGHLFHGKHRQEVIDDILNGPIDLSKILEFGEPIHDLIGGLVNREVAQRLGSRGAAADIKGHGFFAGCDWLTLSNSNTVFKPAQFVNKQFHLQDKLQFYDAVATTQSMMNQRNVATMQRFQTNRQRVREAKKGVHLRSIAKYALSGAVQEKRRLLVRGQIQRQSGAGNRRIRSGQWTIADVQEKDDDQNEDDLDDH